ncbi:hypothetical protein MPRF_37190 [Mycolicibacterium parafortuitum]|uniref:Uncharacterized protein n=1 Tax=Mycolicibacterium parafortuitum TaxID=39692 RepID=A0A7I7U691_MYCPF|nr:hypothetical protein MPRF_37190 [Mycolicibacterium parafortuitum]
MVEALRDQAGGFTADGDEQIPATRPDGATADRRVDEQQATRCQARGDITHGFQSDRAHQQDDRAGGQVVGDTGTAEQDLLQLRATANDQHHDSGRRACRRSAVEGPDPFLGGKLPSLGGDVVAVHSPLLAES